MTRFLTWLVALPAALVLIALALANRNPVRLALNPFRPEDMVLSIQLPFYVYLLLALIVGVVLGGVATWINQGHWRSIARSRTYEARRWQSEAERLVRERDEMVASGKAGEVAGGRAKSLAIAGR